MTATIGDSEPDPEELKRLMREIAASFDHDSLEELTATARDAISMQFTTQTPIVFNPELVRRMRDFARRSASPAIKRLQAEALAAAGPAIDQMLADFTYTVPVPPEPVTGTMNVQLESSTTSAEAHVGPPVAADKPEAERLRPATLFDIIALFGIFHGLVNEQLKQTGDADPLLVQLFALVLTMIVLGGYERFR